jgi:hypothetical protein
MKTIQPEAGWMRHRRFRFGEGSHSHDVANPTAVPVEAAGSLISDKTRPDGGRR